MPRSYFRALPGLDYSGDEGVTFTYRRKTFRAKLVPDDSMREPWKEHDGHGEVSEWTRRDKRPGEMVLCEDRGNRRYYDFAAAVKTARKDGWDAPPYGVGTPGQKAARAALADFKHLQDWCADRWYWVGVVVSRVDRAGVGYLPNSLWGIESNSGDYLSQVAYELARELL